MRLSRLWCFLVLAASGGCFGGPISDFPQTSTDTRAPNNPSHGNGGSTGDPDDDGSEAPTTPDQGGVGGGPETMDAGLPGAYPEPPTPVYPPTGFLDPDGGCSFVPPDGGVACTGNYCGLTLEGVLPLVQQPSACVSDMAAMELMCQGQIALTLDRCWNWWLYGGGLNYASAGDCVYRELAPAGATPACLDCFLNEYHCALSYCLGPCVDGPNVMLCAACRAEHCGEAFTMCSGLPAP